MSTLRSEGWLVRPSFVPGGPTSDVSLWCDDAGLTQIAGEPAVAWQTPWIEIGAVQLVRSARAMALFATIDSVRYCWRRGSLHDFEAWREIVLAHGGSVTRQRRRAGVWAVVAIVLLASFGGAIAAWFNRGSSKALELSDLRAVNVTLADLPAGWYASSNPILAYLVPHAGQVYVATPTTTAPAANSVVDKAASVFQTCLGVSNARDRVYGAAGQQPDYQVSSAIYATSDLGGAEVATTSQYYATTAMVNRDATEIRNAKFGTCFAVSSVAIVLAGFGLNASAKPISSSWRPVTFLHGLVRGGRVDFTVPGVTSHLQLVVAVIAVGHYEVTVNGVTSSWSKSESFFNDVVNTMLSRVSSTSSRSV